MARSVLVTAEWWRVLGERLGRQALQTAVPVLVAASAAGAAVDLKTILLGLAGVEAVTIAKAAVQSLLDVHPTSDTAWYWQWLDRAAPAAAGVVLAVPLVTAQDALATDWGQVAQKAALAALIAVGSFYVMPPAFTASRDEHAGSVA